MAVPNFAALAEERVGFIKQEDCTTLFCRVEDAPQVFLRLADILADDLAEVDTVQVEVQFSSEHFCRHCLTCSARTGEECADTQSASAAGGESPGFVYGSTLPDVDGDIAQHLTLCFRNYQVTPGGGWFDALGKVIQAHPHQHTAGIPQHMGDFTGCGFNRCGRSIEMRSAACFVPRTRLLRPLCPYVCYSRGAQVKLRYQHIYFAVEMVTGIAQCVLPDTTLFVWSWLAYLQAE